MPITIEIKDSEMKLGKRRKESTEMDGGHNSGHNEG